MRLQKRRQAPPTNVSQLEFATAMSMEGAVAAIESDKFDLDDTTSVVWPLSAVFLNDKHKTSQCQQTGSLDIFMRRKTHNFDTGWPVLERVVSSRQSRTTPNDPPRPSESPATIIGVTTNIIPLKLAPATTISKPIIVLFFYNLHQLSRKIRKTEQERSNSEFPQCKSLQSQA